MARTNFKELLDAGVHFGHLKKKYNPAMYELYARYFPTEPWSYCNDGVNK